MHDEWMKNWENIRRRKKKVNEKSYNATLTPALIPTYQIFFLNEYFFLLYSDTWCFANLYLKLYNIMYNTKIYVEWESWYLRSMTLINGFCFGEWIFFFFCRLYNEDTLSHLIRNDARIYKSISLYFCT